MGRRSEQRIAISFPVIVRGSDSHGSPFVVAMETHDISFSGASLKDLNGIAVSGMKIEIESQDKKAWYRVQWVGTSGTSKAGRIGVRCLEPGKYIWSVPPKEREPDLYDPSKPQPSASQSAGGSSTYAAPPSFGGQDRRQFARHACRTETQVMTGDNSIGQPGKITDISLGGCYVEMLSPLPVDSNIQLSLDTGDAILQVSAKVCSSQSGFGMGVSFSGMCPEDFERLRKFAPPTLAYAETLNGNVPQLVNSPPARPDRPRGRVSVLRTNSHSYTEPEIDSLDLPATQEALEAVVRLLLHKGLFTRAELAEELGKLKAAKTQFS